ncbi:VOC family protein [Nonomuraea thailandensis]
MTTVTPYLMVHSARQFTDYAAHVFGAQAKTLIPLDGDPERVVHGEMRIGDSTIYFADARIDGEQCLPPYREGRIPPARRCTSRCPTRTGRTPPPSPRAPPRSWRCPSRRGRGWAAGSTRSAPCGG